jgi:N-acetylglutamate synthase-like GNAT family acetyltransferase
LKITFRKATQEDIDFLFDLRIQTMTEHYESSHLATDKESTLKRIQYKFDKAQIILLDNQPVGLLKINRTESLIEILQIQINPKLQGKGIGRRILTDILREASSLQKSTRLSVLKTNRAKNLYAGLGFKITDEDQHSFHMEIVH